MTKKKCEDPNCVDGRVSVDQGEGLANCPVCNKDKVCQTCGKKPGRPRIDNGLDCGTHCSSCWDEMVAECRSRSW